MACQHCLKARQAAKDGIKALGQGDVRKAAGAFGTTMKHLGRKIVDGKVVTNGEGRDTPQG